MNQPLVGVLALQGDVPEHLAALTSAGARAVRVRTAGELADVDALVVPGGESTTISRLARIFDVLQPLRDRVSGGMPCFGSCAGMILLADRVLDGRSDQEGIGGMDVTVRRNAFGRQVASFETDLEVEGIEGGPMHAVFIRAPWIEEAGPAVHPLASVADGPAAGRIVAARQGHLLACSFHPELTSDARLHAYFVDMVRGQR